MHNCKLHISKNSRHLQVSLWQTWQPYLAASPFLTSAMRIFTTSSVIIISCVETDSCVHASWPTQESLRLMRNPKLQDMRPNTLIQTIWVNRDTCLAWNMWHSTVRMPTSSGSSTGEVYYSNTEKDVFLCRSFLVTNTYTKTYHKKNDLAIAVWLLLLNRESIKFFIIWHSLIKCLPFSNNFADVAKYKQRFSLP